MSYKIREMEPGDNSAMAELIRVNLKKHNLDIPGTVYFDSILDNLYEFYSGDKKRGYYVMTDENGRVIGGIGLDEFVHIPDCAELQKLYLDDSAKGKGLSYKLVEFIEDKMREKGYKSAYLETHHNLQVAIHLYERCGYKKIGRPKEIIHSAMTGFYFKKL